MLISSNQAFILDYAILPQEETSHKLPALPMVRLITFEEAVFYFLPLQHGRKHSFLTLIFPKGEEFFFFNFCQHLIKIKIVVNRLKKNISTKIMIQQSLENISVLAIKSEYFLKGSGPRWTKIVDNSLLVWLV